MKLKKLILIGGLATVLSYPMMSLACGCESGCCEVAQTYTVSPKAYLSAHPSYLLYQTSSKKLNAYVDLMKAMGNSQAEIENSMKGVSIDGKIFAAVDQAKLSCYNSQRNAHIVKAAEEAFQQNIAKLSQSQLRALDEEFKVVAGDDQSVRFANFLTWNSDEDLTITSRHLIEG